jgi:crotonobetainyl-CoA:carnitine CoA-transferase CaiB-like acyl-CoA transferase
MMHQPLKGVRVVELGIWAAAPMCGKLLGDWGADVIKVESLDGDPSRTSGAANYGLKVGDPYENPAYENRNLNTRSITLDLKTEAGLAAMYDLLSTADVFLTNMRMKAVHKLKLDYETLAPKFPRLVWAQLDGFGTVGPLKDAPGFDLVAFFAGTGLMIDYCEADTAPLTAAIAFGDFTTGGTLAGGIAAALFQREKTGKGEKIMISLMGQALYNQANTIMTANMGTDYYPKSRKKPSSPLINSFRCKDGAWVMVSMLDYNRYFNIVCEMMNRPDLLKDERFNDILAGKKHSAELTEILDGWFARYDYETVDAMLNKADIAHNKIKHLKDIPDDPQALENNYVYWAPSRNGKPMLCVAGPVKFGNIDLPPHKFAALLGEHSVEILKEVGYSDQKIQQLLDSKVTSVWTDPIPDIKS